MATIPKPKPCDQDWLEMKPTERGRMCEQCSKVITDFSRMSWAEIEQVHLQKQEPVCGMYSPAQLQHWGHEIPKGGCGKFAATAALLLSLTASTQASGQSSVKQESTKRTVIYGTVTGKTIDETIDTLAYATVALKNTISVITNKHGQYQLDITDFVGVISDLTIVYSYLGYEEYKIKLDNEIKKGEINYNVELKEGIPIIDFSITKPTLARRIKWTFHRWFARISG